VAPAIVLPVLFALLLRLKLVNYTLTFLPLLAIAAAWGSMWALRWLRRRRLLVLGGALALAVVVEGSSRIAALETSTITPYAVYIAAVHRTIPSGARVVGLHNYWFGFEDTDYRSFVVPLAWMDPGGVPLEQGLQRLRPDAVLLDDRMRTYLTYDPRARAGLQAWLAASRAHLVDQVDDPTYGSMQIYAPDPSAYTGRATRENGGKL
jgi:hypothetical protein